jgi:essential nuclear protein 1
VAVPRALSEKILRTARRQLDEIDADADVDDKLQVDHVDIDDDDDDDHDDRGDVDNSGELLRLPRYATRTDNDDNEDVVTSSRMARRTGAERSKLRSDAAPKKNKKANNVPVGRPFQADGDDDDDDDDDVDDEDVVDDDGGDELEVQGGAEMDASDMAAMELFFKASKATSAASTAPRQARQTLGDIIMQKLQEHKDAITHGDAEDDRSQTKLNPKVRAVYAEVGTFLKSCRSGKLPKAFSLIPTLQNWEEVLWITEPHSWSAFAMLKATTLFANASNEKISQRFYALVLLPRVRDEVQAHKKVSSQVYQAIRKALRKPGAFFKGLVLPLAEDPDTSSKEAYVFCTIIKATSVPLLHSAAALMKLCEMPYTVASAMFLRVLIMKRYALPYKTIDALFVHFMSFLNHAERLPNLWHECLLVYAQRYKTDLEAEQKEALKALLRAHSHFKITPVIRHELFLSECRGGAPPVIDDIDDGSVAYDLTPAQRLAAQLQEAQMADNNE